MGGKHVRAAATAAAAAAAGEAAARAAARERGELANARLRAVPSMPGGMAQRRMGERVGERERVGEVERQGSHGGGGRGVSRDGGGGGGRDSGGRECVACSVSCSIDASVASVAAVAAAVADCVAGGFASRWLSKCSLMKAADTCAVHTGQRTYRGDSASLARFRISHFAEAQNRIPRWYEQCMYPTYIGEKSE